MLFCFGVMYDKMPRTSSRGMWCCLTRYGAMCALVDKLLWLIATSTRQLAILAPNAKIIAFFIIIILSLMSFCFPPSFPSQKWHGLFRPSLSSFHRIRCQLLCVMFTMSAKTTASIMIAKTAASAHVVNAMTTAIPAIVRTVTATSSFIIQSITTSTSTFFFGFSFLITKSTPLNTSWIYNDTKA